jgi:hypothetical protein
MKLLVYFCALLPLAAVADEIIVGDLRVQALSPTLVRIEPKGPNGFENRTSFMVVNRAFTGIPIKKLSTTAAGTLLGTDHYQVLLKSAEAPGAKCQFTANMDASAPIRAAKFPNGATAKDSGDCCSMCDSDSSCTAWIYAGSSENNTFGDVPAAVNCWPLSQSGSQRQASGRLFGCSSKGCVGAWSTIPDKALTCSGSEYKGSLGTKATSADCLAAVKGDAKINYAIWHGESNKGCYTCDLRDRGDPSKWPLYALKGAVSLIGTGVIPPIIAAVVVSSADGKTVLFDSAKDSPAQPQLLHWPAPLKQSAYALVDYPRFYVPDWEVMPIPADAKVDPALVATNGYDFTNNVEGDSYIFILGSDLGSWHASRREFVQLAGPCPVLPDFAFGTWFTWWHSYKEAEAKADIDRWEKDGLPIDVWALDMNW